jgi:hypothetical protein
LITHVVQLRHPAPYGVGITSPRTVKLGHSVVVVDRYAGSNVIACTFGSATPGGPLRGTADVDQLDRAQRAIWKTQRCLVPVVGFHQELPFKGGNYRWGVPQGRLAYLPALRYTISDGGDRHCECQLIVREVPGSGSLPFRLLDVAPGRWLARGGHMAMSELVQDWQQT